MNIYYIVFYRPGSLTLELDKIKVEMLDPLTAVELIPELTLKHGIEPYAFRFKHFISDESGNKLQYKSEIHFINGKVIKYDNANDELKSLMESKKWWTVVQVQNRIHPFLDMCVTVDSYGIIRESMEQYYKYNKMTGRIKSEEAFHGT